jgi:hypothetical protein
MLGLLEDLQPNMLEAPLEFEGRSDNLAAIA